MTDGFLGHALDVALAGVLAAVTALSSPAVDPAPTGSPTGSPTAAPTGRLPLADKVEVPVGQGRLGTDISWPNCPTGLGIPARRTLGKPLPTTGRYVLIGLTNGPGFYPNPCLADQVAYVRSRHLWASAYAVVTYPTPAELQAHGADGPRSDGGLAARLFNSGWSQAEQNVANMRAAGLQPPTLWVDVEPVRPPAPWSSDVRANRTVLEGSIAAYRKAGLQIGVYSTPYLWRSVVGDVDYGFPEWRAAGPTTKQAALAVCAGDDIQGGAPLIGQWSSVDIDSNVLCPGRPALETLRQHFTPY